MKEEIIKISILKDGDKLAFMEFQSGNDPLVYNNTYGTTGFYDLDEVCVDIIKTYEHNLIKVYINI